MIKRLLSYHFLRPSDPETDAVGEDGNSPSTPESSQVGSEDVPEEA